MNLKQGKLKLKNIYFIKPCNLFFRKNVLKYISSADRDLIAQVKIVAIFSYRASMIWIIGEYAERIDNADELLESFLEGFQDENTQVKCQKIHYQIKTGLIKVLICTYKYHDTLYVKYVYRGIFTLCYIHSCTFPDLNSSKIVF